MKTRFIIAGTLATALVLSTAIVPSVASEEGRRNTALGLGAATLYFILKKRPTEAIIGGAATAYAAKRLQDKINARHRRERARAASSSFRRGVASVGSSTRVASSTSSSTSAARPSSQSLVSSAYKKGIAAGYDAGYKKGLSEGFRKGSRTAGSTVLEMPSTSASNTYSRVQFARG